MTLYGTQNVRETIHFDCRGSGIDAERATPSPSVALKVAAESPAQSWMSSGLSQPFFSIQHVSASLRIIIFELKFIFGRLTRQQAGTSLYLHRTPNVCAERRRSHKKRTPRDANARRLAEALQETVFGARNIAGDLTEFAGKVAQKHVSLPSQHHILFYKCSTVISVAITVQLLPLC